MRCHNFTIVISLTSLIISVVRIMSRHAVTAGTKLQSAPGYSTFAKDDAVWDLIDLLSTVADETGRWGLLMMAAAAYTPGAVPRTQHCASVTQVAAASAHR